MFVSSAGHVNFRASSALGFGSIWKWTYDKIALETIQRHIQVQWKGVTYVVHLLVSNSTIVLKDIVILSSRGLDELLYNWLK